MNIKKNVSKYNYVEHIFLFPFLKFPQINVVGYKACKGKAALLNLEEVNVLQASSDLNSLIGQLKEALTCR